MLKAIIFDCDGVIADTEPIHFAALQRLLREEAIVITEEEYFRHYLALDDRAGLIRAFAERGTLLDQNHITALISRKAEYVEPAMRANLRLLPGVSEFVRRASESYPLAVASGALRREIELVLKYGDLSNCFRVVVSAEDVVRSKPFPDPFIKACELLSELSDEPIEPSQCLVVEDSVHGVQAAIQAGMRCLAVTNSYPRKQLAYAQRVVDSLSEVSLDDVREMFPA